MKCRTGVVNRIKRVNGLERIGGVMNLFENDSVDSEQFI
jgi:hypothetical protein